MEIENASDQLVQHNLGFDCFVISLESASNRLTQFRVRNEPTKLKVNHFKAVDGSRLNLLDMPEILAKGTVNYPRGTVGAAMSHLALWKECISRKRNFLIFEDDSCLRHDFTWQLCGLLERYKNWDLILLGCNMDTTIELAFFPGIDFTGRFSVPYPAAIHLAKFSKMTDVVSLCRLKLAFGMCGYIITPKGADELVQKCFPMDNRPVWIQSENRSFLAYGLDCMMATIYGDINAFLCAPPIVMTPNNLKMSQTQRRI